MGLVPAKLARVHTAIAENDPAPALLFVCPVLPDVGLSSKFIDKMAVSVFATPFPLALIVLLLALKDPIAILLVSLPLTLIGCSSLLVKIRSLSLLGSPLKQAVVDLPTVEDVDSGAMEGVPLPAPEERIANGVGEAAFALPFPFRVELPDILSLGEGDIEAIREEPESTNKLLSFLVVALGQIAGLVEALSRTSNV